MFIKYIRCLIVACVCVCTTAVWAKHSPHSTSRSCNERLNQIMKNSDFDYSGEDYHVRIEDIKGGTVIIKVYVRNNLSSDPKKPQMVESVVSWLIIQPQRDGIYQSLNALDPADPAFKKLNIDMNAFNQLVRCIDQ